MLKPCDDWKELISAYLDNELDAKQKAGLEEHLQTCDACRTTLELYSCDQQDAAVALSFQQASEQFADQVMARICSTNPTPIASAVISDNGETPQTRQMVFKFGKPRLRFVEWFAIAGMAIVVAAMIFPTFGKAREKSRHASCMSNQRQIALAAIMYSNEHGERLPSATNWTKELEVEGKLLRCPIAGDLTIAYAYNHEVGDKTFEQINNPTGTPMTFDAREGKPDYRHNDGIISSFVDGHVELINRNYKANWAAQLGNAGGSQGNISNQPTITPPERNYGLADKLLIAYTAELFLKNDNVQKTLEKAELLFRQSDGFLLTSQYAEAGLEGEGPTAVISGRIPSEKLGQFLLDAGNLGVITKRTVTGDDVTAKKIEQQLKLQDLSGNEQNLQDINKRAGSTDARLKVENQRNSAAKEANDTRVEEYLLKRRVVLAEITLHISGNEKKVSTNTYGKVATGSFHALGVFARWLLMLLIPIVIWLPVWGPLLGLVIYFYRKRRKTKEH